MKDEDYIVCISDGDMECAIMDEREARRLYNEWGKVEGIKVLLGKIIAVKE